MRGWGTPPEIALYVGRPLNTVRKWATTGAVPTACRIEDGALMVHAESAARLAERAGSRKRGRMPAA